MMNYTFSETHAICHNEWQRQRQGYNIGLWTSRRQGQMQVYSKISDLGPKWHADTQRFFNVNNCLQLDEGFTHFNILSLVGTVTKFVGMECKNRVSTEQSPANVLSFCQSAV